MDEQERAEIQANMLELKATLQAGERVETRGITARPDGTQGKFVGWLRTGRGAGNAYVEFDGEGRATLIHPSGLRRVGLSPATELKLLREFLERVISFAPDDIDMDGPRIDYVGRLIGLGEESRRLKRIIEKRAAKALEQK